MKSYAEEIEWSLGNGQCPCCYGAGPHFSRSTNEMLIGHQPNCDLAAYIQKAGGRAIYLGEFKASAEDKAMVERAEKNTRSFMEPLLVKFRRDLAERTKQKIKELEKYENN